MSSIATEFKSFPGVPDFVENIRFKRVDLVHAAIAAGRNWRRRASGAALYDIAARVNALRSIIDYSRARNIHATRFYRNLGSTEKGTRSFQLGNTICALIADKKLRIPWLVDLEHMHNRYRIAWMPGNRRADFIGRDPNGDWYAFEAKGRCGEISLRCFNDWKLQARMVRSVNGQVVTSNIVSATFVEPTGFISAIWQDPPSEEGENLEFSDPEFIDTYYEGPSNLLRSGQQSDFFGGNRLTFLPELGIHFGIHPDVVDAREARSMEALTEFARRQYSESTEDDFETDSAKVFADGLIVKLGGNWFGDSGNLKHYPIVPASLRAMPVEVITDPLRFKQKHY